MGAIAEANARRGPPDDFDFDHFEQKFAKKYKDKEDRDKHQAAFERRLEEIKRLNENSDGSVWFDVNPMTDMTEEESKSILTLIQNFSWLKHPSLPNRQLKLHQ